MSEKGRLTDRQRGVIPFLLASPSTKEACGRARINKTTVYEWLKEEAFRQELKSHTEANWLGAEFSVFERATAYFVHGERGIDESPRAEGEGHDLVTFAPGAF